MPIYDTHARSVVVWWPRAVAVVGGRERTASGLNARLRVYRYRVPNSINLGVLFWILRANGRKLVRLVRLVRLTHFFTNPQL